MNVIFFSLALNMLVTISLLIEIVPLHRSSIYYKVDHFHPTEFCFYPSSVCVPSIIDIAPGLKPTPNHYENYSDFIIVTISLSWDEHNLPFNYSRTLKLILLLHLFSFVTIILNPSSSKQISLKWYLIYINTA